MVSDSVVDVADHDKITAAVLDYLFEHPAGCSWRQLYAMIISRFDRTPLQAWDKALDVLFAMTRGGKARSSRSAWIQITAKQWLIIAASRRSSLTSSTRGRGSVPIGTCSLSK